MRNFTRAMLRAGMGLAVSAAVVMGGTATASAATAAPATHNYPGCNPWALQRWNLNGSNTIKATYQGGTYTYSVTIKQYGSCLSGSLTDPYYGPSGTTGPIWGKINKNDVVISFRYPYGSVQGTRTFTGDISKWGNVYGTWHETGTENGTGTWYLTGKAAHACHWHWWNPRAVCPVYPHH